MVALPLALVLDPAPAWRLGALALFAVGIALATRSGKAMDRPDVWTAAGTPITFEGDRLPDDGDHLVVAGAPAG